MSELHAIRKKILKQRGVRTVKEAVDKHRSLAHITKEVSFPKTNLMRYLELKHGESISSILTYGSTRSIEKKYGIDHSTAAKWRRRMLSQVLKDIITDKDTSDAFFGYLESSLDSGKPAEEILI